MYIRFVISEIHKNSHKRQGIFQAIYDLKDAGKLFAYEEHHINGILSWFATYLKNPSSFTKSKTPHAIEKAISWYKDTATEHISKMWEIVAVLEVHGIKVDVIKTDRLGYIVYEDKYQIAAEPFKETST